MSAGVIGGAAFALAGAFLFRLRGGGFWPLGSSHAARGAYACGLALTATVLRENAWLLLLAPALWLGAHPAHEWGRLVGPRDVLERLLRGLVWTAPAGLVLFGLDYPLRTVLILGLAGAADPFAYWIAWRIPSTVRHLAQGGELGEALLGAVIGLALWAALA